MLTQPLTLKKSKKWKINILCVIAYEIRQRRRLLNYFKYNLFLGLDSVTWTIYKTLKIQLKIATMMFNGIEVLESFILLMLVLIMLLSNLHHQITMRTIEPLKMTLSHPHHLLTSLLVIHPNHHLMSLLVILFHLHLQHPVNDILGDL